MSAVAQYSNEPQILYPDMDLPFQVRRMVWAGNQLTTVRVTVDGRFYDMTDQNRPHFVRAILQLVDRLREAEGLPAVEIKPIPPPLTITVQAPEHFLTPTETLSRVAEQRVDGLGHPRTTTEQDRGFIGKWKPKEEGFNPAPNDQPVMGGCIAPVEPIPEAETGKKRRK